MRLLYDGNVVGTILTNHSMSIDEAIVSLEIDVYSDDFPDYDLFNVDWEDEYLAPDNTRNKLTLYQCDFSDYSWFRILVDTGALPDLEYVAYGLHKNFTEVTIDVAGFKLS